MTSLGPLTSRLPLDALIKQGLSLIQQYRLTDANRPLRLRMSGVDADSQIDEVLLVKEARGQWHLNQGLKLELTCLAAHAALPLTPFIGQQLALESVTDRGELFSLCGIITHVKAGESDGALAIYQLQVEDTLSLLNLRRNSRVFLDQSILDITYTLFHEWQQNNPVFASSLTLDTDKLTGNFPRFSFVMQSNETDAQFLKRLWQKAGLNFWIEPEQAYHSGSRFTASLNSETSRLKQRLVLLDDHHAIEASATGSLRYHRADGTEQRDTLTALQGQRQLVPSATHSQQWQPDLATNQSFHGQATQEASLASSGLIDNQTVTAFHPEDENALAEQEQRRMLGYQQQAKQFTGLGNVRDLHIGRWLRIEEHPELDASHSADEKEFTVLGLDFIAQNNLPQALTRQADALLLASKQTLLQPEVATDLHLDPDALLRIKNRFILQRRNIPLVPTALSDLSISADPASSVRSKVQPPVQPLIAVVVGPAGEEVYVDAEYRVQLRFPHLQSEHHRHQGGRGTNNSEGDSAWIPVLSTLAGHQFGLSFIPRIGQTVVVDFLNGDIDLPYVSGVLYDGTHAPAQFNHTGSLPDNRYLSGIVSKEIHSSRNNQLKFDDSPQEIQIQLHSDEQTSQLNLGHLSHPRRQTAKHRGRGLELRTDGQGALRADGLLISTHVQSNASGEVMDAKAAEGQLSLNLQAAKALSELAKNHNSDPLTVLDALQRYIASLSGKANDKQANAFKEALLVLASPDGISLSTPKDIHLQANENVKVGANQSINISSQQHVIAQAGKKLSLFALEGGAKLFAGKGKVEVQAQNANMELTARKTFKLISTEDRIEISAPNEITLNGNGSEVKINAAGVFIKTAGIFNPKAAQHKIESGVKASNATHELPKYSKKSPKDLEIIYEDADGNAPKGETILLNIKNGSKNMNKRVSLDDSGKGIIKQAPYGTLSARQTKHRKG